MNVDNKFNTENNLFISLFDAMPFNVYVADVNTYDLIFVNQKLANAIEENNKQQKCYQAIYQQNSPCSHCPIKQLINSDGSPIGNTLTTELFNDVDDHWYQLQDKCICWPDGRIAKYSIGVNITEQKQTQNLLAEAHAELALKAKSLEILSVTDPLTRLFNRLKMDQTLDAEISRSQRYSSPLSVILLDLDKFKLVNDTYGHIIGDQVLCKVAEILQTTVRKQDFSARWGGEEFFIICPETSLENALLVAEKIRKALENTIFAEVKSVTGSFGVACYQNNESVSTFLARADQGLYQAKAQGRNQVCQYIKSKRTKVQKQK